MLNSLSGGNLGMPDHPVVIHTASSVLEAHQLKNVLAEAGIQAFISNEAIEGLVGAPPVILSAAAKVLVSSEQQAAARQIIGEFLKQSPRREDAAPPTSGHESLDDGSSAGESRPNRRSDVAPGQLESCPDCGRRRTAVCPICQTAGSDFPPGEMPVARESDAEEPPLLICPTCDEPFEPNYLRHCEWCGHDFGSGIVPPEPRGKPPAQPLNLRVIGVALALGAFLCGAMVYFAKLLR